ncbi:thioredoxin family protein [Paenibacillus sp. OV219]|uniref:thioredoxin family protein n=1 Tax=Paenibacillus sp. OV219 TaxID=1884377 RepID=UPI0021087F8B|nr:thioredoxin family protein [Paenibacillus sp. OV219]
MKEITEQQWLQQEAASQGKEAVFFFTPLCGTCRIGLRMLEIAEAAGISTPVFLMNINYAPILREKWRVASVPCLVLTEEGKPVQMEYAMQSVDTLYQLLK